MKCPAWLAVILLAAFAGAPGGTQPPAVVRQGAWIGANASILAGVTIGAKAVVRDAERIRRDYRG